MTIIMNGVPRDVADGTTIAALLLQFDLRPQQVAVEVNRQLVPRARHATHVLASQDTVEIVTLVGGG